MRVLRCIQVQPEIDFIMWRFNKLVRSAVLGALVWVGSGAQALVFAVNEGVSYQVSREEMASRYAAIATDLGKLLKQTVTVEPVMDYPSLRKGLAEKRFDIAMVHPAHISIEAMRGSGYKLLAVTRGYQNYQAQFLVDAKSPLTSLQQLKGARLIAPDEDSITSMMVRATLREAGVNPQEVRLTYTRYQEAVPFAVENGISQVGATAANKLIKGWTDKGGKVIAKSRPVPIKHLIGGGSLTAEQMAQVKEYLLTLDSSEDGRKRLESTRYTGFDRFDEPAMLALGTWLGL